MALLMLHQGEAESGLEVRRQCRRQEMHRHSLAPIQKLVNNLADMPLMPVQA